MQAAPLTQKDIVAKLDELPTLPSIVYELSRVINDPMSSTGDVEKIMGNDQSMIAKVLKLVNSAYYAIPGGVSSLSRAIGYIGFDTINQLVLCASIIKALETKGPQRFDMNQFWKHAMGVAVAAETIAKFVSHPLPADMFTCGLVHDMGKVALYTVAPEEMLRVVDLCRAEKITFVDAETKLEIPKHTQIGFLLAQRWQLPAGIQSAIKYHHVKEASLRGGLTAEANRDVDIVYLANILTHALKFGNSGHDRILGAPTDLMQRLTIDPDRDFKKLLQDTKVALERTADFLRVLGEG